MPRLNSFGGSRGFGKLSAPAPIWIMQSVSNVMTVGVAYTNTISASSATSYFVSFGSLPAGLSLNSSTGVLSGTPTTAGAFSFRLGARNREGLFIETATISGSVTVPKPVVSGGSLSSDATYYYRTFTSNGTFSVSNTSLTAQFFLVGGGGAGQRGNSAGGGGGGGRYTNWTSVSVPTGSHSVTIGSGGSGSNSTLAAGGDTSVGSLATALGGGAGSGATGGASTFNGGGGTATGDWGGAGGGGGTSSAGAGGNANNSANPVGGNGGAGLTFSSMGISNSNVPLIGSATNFGSGGGGGVLASSANRSGGTVGQGGVGAGRGGKFQNGATSATMWGCGGGGNGNYTNAGSGFQGIAIIRYPKSAVD